MGRFPVALQARVSTSAYETAADGWIKVRFKDDSLELQSLEVAGVTDPPFTVRWRHPGGMIVEKDGPSIASKWGDDPRMDPPRTSICTIEIHEST